MFELHGEPVSMSQVDPAIAFMIEKMTAYEDRPTGFRKLTSSEEKMDRWLKQEAGDREYTR